MRCSTLRYCFTTGAWLPLVCTQRQAVQVNHRQFELSILLWGKLKWFIWKDLKVGWIEEGLNYSWICLSSNHLDYALWRMKCCTTQICPWTNHFPGLLKCKIQSCCFETCLSSLFSEQNNSCSSYRALRKQESASASFDDDEHQEIKSFQIYCTWCY